MWSRLTGICFAQMVTRYGTSLFALCVLCCGFKVFGQIDVTTGVLHQAAVTSTVPKTVSVIAVASTSTGTVIQSKDETSTLTTPIIPAVATSSPPLLGPAGVPSGHHSGSSLPEVFQARDILDANDKTVSHVAQMYEKFATFVTIIISIVGFGISIGASIFAVFAFKNLREFRQQWYGEIAIAKKKLGVLIDELKDSATETVMHSVARISENEMRAHNSAAQAEEYATWLHDRQDVLNEYLLAVDALRREVDELRERVGVPRKPAMPDVPPQTQVAPAPALAAIVAETREADAVTALVQQKVKLEVAE